MCCLRAKKVPRVPAILARAWKAHFEDFAMSIRGVDEAPPEGEITRESIEDFAMSIRGVGDAAAEGSQVKPSIVL